MKTGYFWKATHEPEQGVMYISISRQNQRGAEMIPTYKALMPSWDIINLAHRMGYSDECLKIYKHEYYKQLRQLDPRQVYEDLKDCTIICHEAPKDLASGKKFCHRRMVAGWLETELGIVIPEETREKEKHLIIPALYADE